MVMTTIRSVLRRVLRRGRGAYRGEQVSADRLRRREQQEWAELAAKPAIEADGTPLALMSEEQLAAVFEPWDLAKDWARAERCIQRAAIPEGKGGVNAGDRRAIYHLIRRLAPRRVLETGTHLGSSTLAMGIAAKHLAKADPAIDCRVTTIDHRDVNDEAEQPWRRFGSTHSPRQLVHRFGCGNRVEFRVGSSLDYLDGCEESFDLIFLDANHEAPFVYEEVPRALRRLSPGGVILLHDYYPDARPLWSDGYYIAGVTMAIDRLRREGAAIRAMPLGALPWPTKLGSNVTSLALLVAADRVAATAAADRPADLAA